MKETKESGLETVRFTKRLAICSGCRVQRTEQESKKSCSHGLAGPSQHGKDRGVKIRETTKLNIFWQTGFANRKDLAKKAQEGREGERPTDGTPREKNSRREKKEL